MLVINDDKMFFNHREMHRNTIDLSVKLSMPFYRCSSVAVKKGPWEFAGHNFLLSHKLL